MNLIPFKDIDRKIENGILVPKKKILINVFFNYRYHGCSVGFRSERVESKKDVHKISDIQKNTGEVFYTYEYADGSPI